jgi:iron(III) transport system substrate-binding protein
MARRFLTIILLMLVCITGGFSGGSKETPLPAPKPAVSSEEDWNAIYEAAKKEGIVRIYSLSSRIFDALKDFNTLYPAIKVEASDIPTDLQIERLKREQAAGVYNADVLMLADETTIKYEILKKGLAINYVPSTLIDGRKTEEVIPDQFQNPALLHSIEAKVIFYNSENFSKPPIDNLWDFTRPEWKGRFQMKDPIQAAENMNFLQMVVKYSSEMEKAYEEEFGSKLILSKGIENAGYEWIDRIIKNKIVLASSDGTVSDAVGAPGQTSAPIGLCVASSKIRDNAKGKKLAIAWDVKPKFGIHKGNYLLIANNAPHPNAAILLIRYLLGDAEGGKGMLPFYVPGQWPSRSDIKSLADRPLSEVVNLSWPIDTDFVYQDGLKVRDFWISR